MIWMFLCSDKWMFPSWCTYSEVTINLIQSEAEEGGIQTVHCKSFSCSPPDRAFPAHIGGLSAHVLSCSALGTYFCILSIGDDCLVLSCLDGLPVTYVSFWCLTFFFFHFSTFQLWITQRDRQRQRERKGGLNIILW